MTKDSYKDIEDDSKHKRTITAMIKQDNNNYYNDDNTATTISNNYYDQLLCNKHKDNNDTATMIKTLQ